MGSHSDLDRLIADPDALMSDALLEADQAQRVESALPASVRETHRTTLLRWLTVAS